MNAKRKNRNKSRRPITHTNRPRRFTLDFLEQRQLMAAHVLGSTTSYATIQAAVDAAPVGGTVTVDAGSYAEQVTVSKTLTIEGVEAGVDARTNIRREAGVESIVTGTKLSNGSYSAGFIISANDVTIDGFTVQGETNQDLAVGAGIVISPRISGTHILNNIIQNNVSGLFLANYSSTDPAIIQHNIFRGNNNTGTNGGRGIYTDESISGGNLTNVLIDGNSFVNNHGGSGTTQLEAACAFEAGVAGEQSNITLTNNVLDSDGKAVLFFNTVGVLFQGNTVTNGLDWYSGIVRFEGNDQNVTITHNLLFMNTGPALAVDTKGVPGDDSGFVVTYNDIFSNDTHSGKHYGIVFNGDVYDGTFDARYNYWGSPNGPGGDGPGTGDSIYGDGHVVSGSYWSTVAGGGAETFAPWATSPNISDDQPYWGVASTDGAKIQAEDFDQGGQGNGYNDSDTNNNGGKYRSTAVDIETTSDTGGGYDVGWTKAGEWLDYAINLTEGGTYAMSFRLASGAAGATFHVNIDGVNVTGAITVPSTGGYQSWQTVNVTGIPLTSGNHILRLNWDTNNTSGSCPNFNWFQLTNTNPVASPTAPTNLVATSASSASVNLNWTNTASTATGIKIERSTEGTNYTALTTLPAGTTEYTDSTVSPVTTYYYTVVATNAAGDSPNSNVATATTLPSATAPTYLSSLDWASATVGYGAVQKDASINGNTITLRGKTYWRGIGTHAVSQIVYNLNGEYGTFQSDVGVDDETNGQGAVDFQVIGDGQVLFDSGVLTGASPVVHISLNISGVQQLTLVATNGVNGSIDYDHADWAGAQLLVAAPAPAAPAGPSNLSAVATSSTTIDLAWANNATNQTGFTITRSTNGAPAVNLVSVGDNTTTYTDSTALASTTYTYAVVAINAVGDSTPSNSATATTPDANATVTNLSTLNWTSGTTGYGTLQKNASINGNTLSLRGTTYGSGIGAHAQSTITYALNGQYTAFLSDVGVDDETSGQGAVDFQVVGDGHVLFDSGVLTGASPVVHINVSVAGVQTLQIIASPGIAGTIDYDHSDWAGARLLGAPVAPSVPADPSDFTAIVGSFSTVYLAWTNNANNQTGFTITRSTNGAAAVNLATIGTNATIYTDTTAAAGTTYTYTVIATNAVGNSMSSNTATVTTLAANATVTNLSTLNWTSATTGYGTIQENATIKGNTLSLRGTTYSSGIGTHAQSTITYALDGQYTAFLSDVGVDDETSGQGAVDFQVVGDGMVLFHSGVLTGTSPIVHINVDVTGVQTLQIIASPGIVGSIDFDHADWAGAQLVSNNPAPMLANTVSPFSSTGTITPLSTKTKDDTAVSILG